jgi:hypothetical protein
MGIIRYQPLPRLNVTAKLMLIETGRDETGFNWGGDILKNNSLTVSSVNPPYVRPKSFDNSIAQGVKNDLMLATFTATWQLKHNLFIDGAATIRKSESASAVFNNNTSVTSLALRWNIPQRLYEF